MLIQNQNKRVVAVHDLSCMGRVSLMAVVPILSSMGLEVCPLPTALLSCHTQYPEFTFLDLTVEMKRIIANWKSQGFRFNAFYTGYLGSPEQVQIVEDLIRDFRRPTDLTVVDPVLGDNGKLYKGMNEEMVNQMRGLIRLADVITPNMTEMFLLLGEDLSKLNDQWSMFNGQCSTVNGQCSEQREPSSLLEWPSRDEIGAKLNRQSSMVNDQSSMVNVQSSMVNGQSSIVNGQSSMVNVQSSIVNGQSVNGQCSMVNVQSEVDSRLKTYLKELSDQGPAIVIVTSVPVIGNPHLTSVYAYNRNGNRYWKVTCPFLPAHYPGTGDAFTSVITGSLMQGDSLPLALDRATQFTLQGIRSTFGYEYNNMEGIMLEKVLSNLNTPIQVSSFELI